MRLMREEIYEKATTAAGNGGNSLTELTPVINWDGTNASPILKWHKSGVTRGSQLR